MRKSRYNAQSSNRTIDYIHDHLGEMIFALGKTENLPFTYPQTEDLLTLDDTGGLSWRETTTILNLRDAFDFLFENWQNPVTLDTVLEYNAYIGSDNLEENPGELREDYEVLITGVNYKPAPIYASEASDIINASSILYPKPIEQAIYLALTISKKQFCCNGNKRTALMVCNHVLSYYDAGYVFAPITYTNDGGTLFDLDYIDFLVDFYEDVINLPEAIQEGQGFLWKCNV